MSSIQKNEKIDMDMIRNLINKTNELSREKKEPVRIVKEEIIEDEEDRIYDIRDVLKIDKKGNLISNSSWTKRN